MNYSLGGLNCNSSGQKTYSFRKAEWQDDARIRLPALITEPDDLVVVHQRSQNLILSPHAKLKARLLFLNRRLPSASSELSGKIVVLEAADPGYDWIFSSQIAALVTKYGGVASHMAIRAAQFGIPAVIGCGDGLYNEF